MNRFLALALLATALTLSACSTPAPIEAPDDDPGLGQSDSSGDSASSGEQDELPAATAGSELCDLVTADQVSAAYLVSDLGPAVRSTDTYGAEGCAFWDLPPGSANVVLGHTVSDDPSGMGSMVYEIRTYGEHANVAFAADADVIVTSPADILGGAAQQYQFTNSYASQNNHTYSAPGLGGFCVDFSACYFALDETFWVELIQFLDNNAATEAALVRLVDPLSTATSTLN
jgi:hypothetical protein